MNSFLTLTVITLCILGSKCESQTQSECLQEEFKSDLISSDENLSGGFRAIKVENLNSPTILSVTKNGGYLLNKDDESFVNYYRITCVKSGAQQVVAGIIYVLNVTLTETECEKENLLSLSNNAEVTDELLTELESCQLLEKQKNCLLKVLHQPWLSPKHVLLSHECISESSDE